MSRLVPVLSVLHAMEESYLALPKISRRRLLVLSAGALLTASPLGSLTARAAASYKLPYPQGLVWPCVQGINSGGSHSGRAAFAWDFRMPEGSPLLASRGGVVSMLKQDSNANCRQNIYACPELNNYIVIDHGDGTSSCYLHGYPGGARIRLGQTVRQGDYLGLSGFTGQAAGPHVHFQVQYNDPRLYLSQSFLIRFDEVPGDGVPVRRGSYQSANAPLPDFDIRDGHFYTQSNGTGAPGHGFSVTNEQNVPMWTILLGGGGATTVGYPLSRRFYVPGVDKVYQIFQRQIFEWSNPDQLMRAINIPELPPQPIDPASWLATQNALPVGPDLAVADRFWDQYVQSRLAPLDSQPRMKEVYWSVDDPISRFGFPLGPATDTPQGVSMRFERVGFSISRRDSGFSKAGDLSVSVGGDMVLDAQPFSRQVFQPEPLFPEYDLNVLQPGPAPAPLA